MSGPAPTLRQKRRLDPRSTDRQLFDDLVVGDLWGDAGVVDVYHYLRKGYSECIPESWVATFDKFDADLASP